MNNTIYYNNDKEKRINTDKPRVFPLFSGSKPDIYSLGQCCKNDYAGLGYTDFLISSLSLNAIIQQLSSYWTSVPT